MQANSQHSGQPQNLHGKGVTPDGTSNGSFYQLYLPPHSSSPSGQPSPGNYLTQVTCSVKPSTGDQILNTSVQATKDAQLAQENKFNTKYTLATGKQDSQIILWNMPSNCQIFIPVNNANLQVAPTNNGPNKSHCAFNSNKIVYMQQQTTSLTASTNPQQLHVSTLDAMCLHEARRNVNASFLYNRQQYANASPNLSKESSKTRTSLPSDLTYYPLTENAPHSQSGLFGGYHNQLKVPERSTHANVQALSTSAQRAVAVVTPLSPIVPAPVNISENANVKKNERSVGTVHHFPKIPHTPEVSVLLKNHTAEPKDPASKQQRPKSAEPRLSNEVEAKSPIWNEKSTSRGHCSSSPKLTSMVPEHNLVPTVMQNEQSEKINNNCTITEETETVPVIEWPLDRLHTLIAMIQQIEDGRSKNVQKTDAGKDIIKLYWNGDSRKFYDAVQTGIYQRIMEEVYIYCPTKEPVILRQIKTDARNKVSKDFHLLKHNEVPPKMTYKSSWLNLNENVDDIDKECGYNWFLKSFQNSTEHEPQDQLKKAPEEPSLPSCKQSPAEGGNEVPAEEQTLDNKGLHENLPVLFKDQSPPLTDANCLSKNSCVVTEQSNSQPTDTNSMEAAITVMEGLDKQDVPTEASVLDDQYRNDVRVKSDASPKSTSQSCCTTSTKFSHVVLETQEVVSSEIQIGFSEKVPKPDSVRHFTFLSKTTMTQPGQIHVYTNEKETDIDYKAIATSADKHETSLNATQNLDTVSTEEQVPVELQMSLEKNLFSEFDCEKSPPMIENYPPKLNVVKEQNGSQPNATNPLKAMTNLVRLLKQREFSLKYRNSGRKISGFKRKHQDSSTISRLNRGFRSDVGAKSPVLTISSQSDYTRPSPTNPLLCFKNIAEEDAKIAASASVKMNALPHEMHEQCFASSLMQDEDATQPETSLLCTPQVNVTISAKERISMGSFEKTNGNVSSKCSVDVEQTNCQSNTGHPPKAMKTLAKAVGETQHHIRKVEVSKSIHQQSTAISLLDDPFCNRAKSPDVEMDDLTSFRINVLPHEVAKQCFAGQFMEDISAPPQMMHKLTDRSMSQTDCKSPPKLYPVISEPYQMHNESIEAMPDSDYVLTDESVRCKPDPRSNQELLINRNKEETDKVDALDSIKINVLPHEMAELWFASEMECKVSSHISNEDQVEVQNLELKLEKDVLLEDVKPKRNYQSSCYEKLESFCCLAKWFQTLECGNASLCRCQEKEIETEVHNTCLQVQTKEEDPKESESFEMEDTVLSESSVLSEAEDEKPLPNDPPVGKTEKDISKSEEVCRVEPVRDSPSKCAKNVTLRNNDVKQDTQALDLKKTSTICLSLYGSSSEKREAMPARKYKGMEKCEEPPETLQITIESHEMRERKRKSKKRKRVYTEDDAVKMKEGNQRAPFKNLHRRKTLPSHTVYGLSSTSIRKLSSKSVNAKSDVHLGEGNKRKKQIKCATQQISMNKFIIRGKNFPSKLLRSSENITKSKYELGNPALMPLEEGLSLEFKVLPESFNFEEGAENCTQGDPESQSTQNGMSVPECDDAKMTTSTTQGVWSFSPLKKKRTMDVPGPCSLFQEFKKKYNEITSRQTLNSRQRP